MKWNKKQFLQENLSKNIHWPLSLNENERIYGFTKGYGETKTQDPWLSETRDLRPGTQDLRLFKKSRTQDPKQKKKQKKTRIIFNFFLKKAFKSLISNYRIWSQEKKNRQKISTYELIHRFSQFLKFPLVTYATHATHF